MEKRTVIYYSDELNDEFSVAQISARPIDENYFYGDNSFKWNFKHVFWYRIIATPLAWLFLKIKFNHKIVNRSALKPYRKQAVYFFGNHTNAAADALIPTFVNYPKHTYVIVHPNNVSMPIAGKITPYLGAIPLPDNIAATKNFMNVLKLRVAQKKAIMIYPEAHVWPYYTKIRPFTDMSFRYPIQHKTPVFCFTNTYHKRWFTNVPRIITYIDGPFFPDEKLGAKEQRAQLRNAVYEAMCKRAELSDVERIHYEKKTPDSRETR